MLAGEQVGLAAADVQQDAEHVLAVGAVPADLEQFGALLALVTVEGAELGTGLEERHLAPAVLLRVQEQPVEGGLIAADLARLVPGDDDVPFKTEFSVHPLLASSSNSH